MSPVTCEIVCASEHHTPKPTEPFARFSRVPCVGEHVVLSAKSDDGPAAPIQFLVVQVVHQTGDEAAASLIVTTEPPAGTR